MLGVQRHRCQLLLLTGPCLLLCANPSLEHNFPVFILTVYTALFVGSWWEVHRECHYSNQVFKDIKAASEYFCSGEKGGGVETGHVLKVEKLCPVGVFYSCCFQGGPRVPARWHYKQTHKFKPSG